MLDVIFRYSCLLGMPDMTPLPLAAVVAPRTGEIILKWPPCF